LEKQQNEIITSQVKSALRYAQENQVDIFGIGDAVYHKHPIKWTAIKDSWIDVFSKLDFIILVESKINRTYELREPVKGLEGEK
jgi:spore germination protein KC